MINFYIFIILSSLLFLSCQTRHLDETPISDSNIPKSWVTKINESPSDTNQTFWAESFNIPSLTKLIVQSLKKSTKHSNHSKFVCMRCLILKFEMFQAN